MAKTNRSAESQPTRIETMAEPTTDEEIAEHGRFIQLMESHPWRFAKTMPENPHWYTLRKHWVDEEFVWAELYIRRAGYRSKWKGTWYTQVDAGDYFYWTFGGPIGTAEEAAAARFGDWRITSLINRKPMSAKP